MRPALPRYWVTWDVNRLLTFLRTWHPISSLSLKALTLKTVTLVAVTSSDRAQTINAMDIEHCTVSDEGILFPIHSLLKNSRRNHPIRVVKCHNFTDPALNVSEYVLAYLRRTFKFRLRAVDSGLPKPTSLFLSYHTGKQVRTSTLSKYILTTMELAGIDTDVYKAHTTRGAFPSLMRRKGCSANNILEQGDWSSISTFQRYYSRESEDTQAGRLIQEVLGKKRN